MPVLPVFSLNQAVQLAGAAAVLFAYAGQRHLSATTRESWNLFGALCLVASAGVGGQMGFFVLNAIWAGIAAYRLWTQYTERATTRALPTARIH